MSPSRRPPLVMAMPLTAPFGGMSTYANLIASSEQFSHARFVDTTPPRPPYGALARAWRSLAIFARQIRTVVATRPRVFYVMSSDFLGFYEKAAMVAVAKLFGCQVVLHMVGDYAAFYEMSVKARRMHRAAFRQCSRVIVVSNVSGAAVRHLIPESCVVVLHNPVDLPALPPPPQRGGRRDVSVLFLSSAIVSKGIFDLIAAAEYLRAMRVPVRITIAGGGDDLALATAEISRRGLQDLLHCTGPVDEREKLDLLLRSDIFVLPTHTEGLPIALLDAMAAGLPVVATRVGGIPDLVTHGVSGFLVRPGDYRGLAVQIARLAEDPEARRRVGEAARHRVAEECATDRVLQMLRKVIDEASPDAPA